MISVLRLLHKNMTPSHDQHTACTYTILHALDLFHVSHRFAKHSTCPIIMKSSAMYEGLMAQLG